MATYLIGPREDRDGPVPQVPRVVDLLVPHFHLGVFQPQRDVSVVGQVCSLTNFYSVRFITFDSVLVEPREATSNTGVFFNTYSEPTREPSAHFP